MKRKLKKENLQSTQPSNLDQIKKVKDDYLDQIKEIKNDMKIIIG